MADHDPTDGDGKAAPPSLTLVTPPADQTPAPGVGRDHRTERDVLAGLVGDIDRAIAALPTSSPWRDWLARNSRILRDAANLQTLMRARDKEQD